MNTAIVPTSNVSGNIGSCEIKSDSYNVDLFHVQVVAVNSCTGRVISQNVMFDFDWFFYVPFALCIGVAFLKMVFD